MSSEFDIETEVRRLTPLEQAVLKARFGVPPSDRRSRPRGPFPRSAAELRRIERRALRKLRRDSIDPSATGRNAAPPAPPQSSEESAELLNMAVFKLRDCAQRMRRLADAAPSPALGAKFLSIYRQLVQQEEQLQTASHAVASVPRPARRSSAAAIT